MSFGRPSLSSSLLIELRNVRTIIRLVKIIIIIAVIIGMLLADPLGVLIIIVGGIIGIIAGAGGEHGFFYFSFSLLCFHRMAVFHLGIDNILNGILSLGLERFYEYVVKIAIGTGRSGRVAFGKL